MPTSGRSKRKKPEATAGSKVQRGIKDHFSPTPASASHKDAIVLVDDHDDDDDADNHVEDMTEEENESSDAHHEVVALDAEDDSDYATSNSTATSTSSSSTSSSRAPSTSSSSSTRARLKPDGMKWNPDVKEVARHVSYHATRLLQDCERLNIDKPLITGGCSVVDNLADTLVLSVPYCNNSSFTCEVHKTMTDCYLFV